METIGQRLRQGRERLGLSLEEAERTTHIRAQHLAALERDEFGVLPSPVQARGFLKNYADYLGLDTERLLQDYAGGASQRRAASTRPAPPRTEVRVRRRGWLSSDLLVAATIALGTLALIVWGGGRLMASLRAAATPAEQSSAFLIPTPTLALASATSAPTTVGEFALAAEAPSATPTLPPLNLPGSGVSVRLLVVQRAWVLALADGQQRYLGRFAPGAVLDLSGERLVEVSTGNGAGLRVTLNGTDMGTMGGLDEAVTRLWTPDGEITPTPTVTPTPTATLRPTATPFGAAPLGPTG